MEMEKTGTETNGKIKPFTQEEEHERAVLLQNLRQEIKICTSKLDNLTGSDRTVVERHIARQEEIYITERNYFADKNIGLIKTIAREVYIRTSYLGAEYEDILNDGYCLMLEYIDTFDPRRGRFGTYMRFARLELLTVVWKQKLKIALPEWVTTQLNKLREAERTQANGDAPQYHAKKLAKQVGITQQALERLLEIRKSQYVSSLETPLQGMDGDVSLGDIIADHAVNPEKQALSAINREAIRKTLLMILEGMPELERLFIKLRFGIFTEAIDKKHILPVIRKRTETCPKDIYSLEARAIQELRKAVDAKKHSLPYPEFSHVLMRASENRCREILSTAGIFLKEELP